MKRVECESLYSPGRVRFVSGALALRRLFVIAWAGYLRMHILLITRWIRGTFGWRRYRDGRETVERRT